MEMTMTTYTKEKKEHALSLMAAPLNKPVAEVMELTGIPKATLFLWRKQAREQGPGGPW
jgi:transposase